MIHWASAHKLAAGHTTRCILLHTPLAKMAFIANTEHMPPPLRSRRYEAAPHPPPAAVTGNDRGCGCDRPAAVSGGQNPGACPRRAPSQHFLLAFRPAGQQDTLRVS